MRGRSIKEEAEQEEKITNIEGLGFKGLKLLIIPYRNVYP